MALRACRSRSVLKASCTTRAPVDLAERDACAERADRLGIGRGDPLVLSRFLGRNVAHDRRLYDDKGDVGGLDAGIAHRRAHGFGDDVSMRPRSDFVAGQRSASRTTNRKRFPIGRAGRGIILGVDEEITKGRHGSFATGRKQECRSVQHAVSPPGRERLLCRNHAKFAGKIIDV